MSVGFVLLVHTALDRAAQVARHLAKSGCPVAIHIDQSVGDADAQRFRSILRTHDQIRFCRRYRCEWGTWSIVAATQAAAQMLLEDYPEVGHVFLASGSCLPLRPVGDLIRFLEGHENTDFIESVTTADVRWTRGGLDLERFTLHFPFAWKKRRRLFDRFVDLQRRIGIRRRLPAGLAPHLGSQWWCLSRGTLEAVLRDPQREEIERYFRSVWIPDEAYFQTLVRRHSDRIEARSLTLSKFDYQGRPYTFYDDHLELLRRSHCFFARKIWPKADRLYQSFLGAQGRPVAMAEADPGRIDRHFAQAVSLRTHGRPGLVMQSRRPSETRHRNRTAWPYTVLQGFDEIFDNFEGWLSRAAATTVHGRLFHPRRVEFAGGQTDFKGGLTSNPYLRDYDRAAFLRNFIWNTRGERQFLMYAPDDGREAWTLFAQDPNAQISVVTGAWAVRLLRANLPFDQARARAALLQRQEQQQLNILGGPQTRAKVRILTLSDYLASPMEPLQMVIDEAVSPEHSYLGEAPRLTRINGLNAFLKRLRDSGMQPYIAGHIPTALPARKVPSDSDARKTLAAR